MFTDIFTSSGKQANEIEWYVPTNFQPLMDIYSIETDRTVNKKHVIKLQLKLNLAFKYVY